MSIDKSQEWQGPGKRPATHQERLARIREEIKKVEAWKEREPSFETPDIVLRGLKKRETELLMDKPILGRHAFSGYCAPKGDNPGYDSKRTFSVGCFQWVARKGNKPPDCFGEFKKSPVKVRVSGLVSSKHAVFDKARDICFQLDTGTYTGPKHVKVK